MTHRLFRSVIALLAAFCLFTVTAPARAATDFPADYTKPVAIVVPGTAQSRLYIITATGRLAYADIREPAAWTYTAMPVGISFDGETGLAAAVAPSSTSWGGPRIFAVATATPYHLWEFATTANTWTDLGSPATATFNNHVRIDGFYYTGSQANQHVFAAVVTRTMPGKIWICDRATPTSACTWSNVNPSTNGTESTSSVAFDQPLNGTIGVDLDIYTVSSSHYLQRRRFFGGAWTTLARPTGYQIEWLGTRLNPISTNTDTRIVYAAWDGASGGDDLFESKFNGTTWTTYRLTPTSAPLHWVSWGVNNVHRTRLSGAEALIATDTNRRRVWNCKTEVVPPSGGVETCPAVNSITSTLFPRPADLQSIPVDRDLMGTGVVVHQNLTGARTYMIAPGHMFTGTGSVVYMYKANLDAVIAWENMLAPRPSTTLLPWPTYTPELIADEFWGHLAVIDPYATVWRSDDDGSTWVADTLPIGGDSNVVFDANGTLYAAIDSAGLNITRHLGSGVWTAAGAIPSSVPMDRPWVAADRTRPNFLLATHESASGGKIAYCHGSSTCENASAWCPTSPQPLGSPWDLPSADNCNAFGAGCFVEQAGDGNVWVTVSGDTACAAPSLYGYTHVVGVRFITNRASLGSGCAPPILSSPDCLYYVAAAAQAQLRNVAGSGIPIGPGEDRHFPSRLTGAPDNGQIAVTLQTYNNTATGGPCTTSSVQCRADVVFARRFSTGLGWCTGSGTGCWLGNVQSWGGMFRANGDTYTTWVDHTLPQFSFLDREALVTTWHDFRDDPADASWKNRTRTLRFAGTVQTYTSESAGWPAGTAAPWIAGSFYGDIDRPATNHLHTHFFTQYPASGYGSMMVLWSPASPNE